MTVCRQNWIVTGPISWCQRDRALQGKASKWMAWLGLSKLDKFRGNKRKTLVLKSRIFKTFVAVLGASEETIGQDVYSPGEFLGLFSSATIGHAMHIPSVTEIHWIILFGTSLNRETFTLFILSLLQFWFGLVGDREAICECLISLLTVEVCKYHFGFYKYRCHILAMCLARHKNIFCSVPSSKQD